MAIYRLGDHTPQLAPSAFVADGATGIGRVELAEGASVWYGSVLRGDNDWIRIGRNSNVQDASVLHTDHGIPLQLGENVSVGHQCMLHGCTIGDGSLIGIQSVILNRARIGRHSIVGAGALVTEGKEFPDGAMILGSPAKVVRMLRDDEVARLAGIAAHYIEQAERHRTQMERVD
jgi:carbonic anhydrase/acetyltransferase-like protein (isoleucine patch superfamily)